MKTNSKLSLILGWISLITPWLCVLGVMSFPPSISSLYYTTAEMCLYGPLLIGAILLIIYKGKNRFENILTTIAGVAAIGICIFPCSPVYIEDTESLLVNFGNITCEKIGLFRLDPEISNFFHTLFAATFFTMLSFVIGVLCEDVGKLGKKRNIVYRVCGILSMCSMYLNQLPDISTWLIECIAMTFLGFAWLTKANKYGILWADGTEFWKKLSIKMNKKIADKKEKNKANTKKSSNLNNNSKDKNLNECTN